MARLRLGDKFSYFLCFCQGSLPASNFMFGEAETDNQSLIVDYADHFPKAALRF